MSRRRAYTGKISYVSSQRGATTGHQGAVTGHKWLNPKKAPLLIAWHHRSSNGRLHTGPFRIKELICLPNGGANCKNFARARASFFFLLEQCFFDQLVIIVKDNALRTR